MFNHIIHIYRNNFKQFKSKQTSQWIIMSSVTFLCKNLSTTILVKWTHLKSLLFSAANCLSFKKHYFSVFSYFVFSRITAKIKTSRKSAFSSVCWFLSKYYSSVSSVNGKLNEMLTVQSHRSLMFVTLGASLSFSLAILRITFNYKTVCIRQNVYGDYEVTMSLSHGQLFLKNIHV